MLSHEEVCNKPMLATYVSVRFRYDRSKFNFIYRQFKRVHGIHLCAFAAASRIIRRANLGRLLNPLTDPVGLFLEARMGSGTPFVDIMLQSF